MSKKISPAGPYLGQNSEPPNRENKQNLSKNRSTKFARKYWNNLKISGPNGLSKCPESREMDFGPFRGKYCLSIFRRFFGPTFFEKMDLRRVLWPKCQVKKVSYIDPLVMRFSPKSEFLIENFHQFFSFW